MVIDLGPTGSEKAEDGLQFFDRFSSPIFFDYDNDGFKERTAWVGPNEGIVVWDKNRDITVNATTGVMTGGSISTNEVVLTKGAATGKTDLDALIQGIDKNGDGVIEDWEADGKADNGTNGGTGTVADKGLQPARVRGVTPGRAEIAPLKQLQRKFPVAPACVALRS